MNKLPLILAFSRKRLCRNGKNPSATLFVISSAARNLRSLTFVRDDNMTFGDCDTVSEGRRNDSEANQNQIESTNLCLSFHDVVFNVS
jgi:hypothetical protein